MAHFSVWTSIFTRAVLLITWNSIAHIGSQEISLFPGSFCTEDTVITSQAQCALAAAALAGTSIIDGGTLSGGSPISLGSAIMWTPGCFYNNNGQSIWFNEHPGITNASGYRVAANMGANNMVDWSAGGSGSICGCAFDTIWRDTAAGGGNSCSEYSANGWCENKRITVCSRARDTWS